MSYYAKITIIKGNMSRLVDHLEMNRYTFDRIGQSIYVLEDEVDYVETILQDWKYDYDFE